MRQSLVQRLNCGTAELQDKEYSVCGIRTAELKVTAYSLCGSGTSSHRILCVRKRNFKSHNILRVEYLWFLMQWPEWHESAGATGPWVVALGSKPSWRCCYLLFHLGGGPYWDFLCFLRYYEAVTTQLTYDKDPDIRQTSWPKAAGTKLPTGSTRQSKSEFSTL